MVVFFYCTAPWLLFFFAQKLAVIEACAISEAFIFKPRLCFSRNLGVSRKWVKFQSMKSSRGLHGTRPPCWKVLSMAADGSGPGGHVSFSRCSHSFQISSKSWPAIVFYHSSLGRVWVRIKSRSQIVLLFSFDLVSTCRDSLSPHTAHLLFVPPILAQTGAHSFSWNTLCIISKDKTRTIATYYEINAKLVPSLCCWYIIERFHNTFLLPNFVSFPF